VVCVIDGVQHLATLRGKSTDLAVAPSTDDALPILQGARKVRQVSEQLHAVWVEGKFFQVSEREFMGG
jgi:hypothetical protein